MSPQDIVISVGAATANISPIGFHGYASEFATYARQAREGSAGRFSPVSYYLYCHSLELVLKAFLLAKGVQKENLKKRSLGHDLCKILTKAKALGLEQEVPLAAGWEVEIQKANSYYADKRFEYFHVIAAFVGYPDLPAFNVLNEIVTTLLEKLEQTCLAA